MNNQKRKIIEEFWLNRLSGDLPKLTLPLVNKSLEESGRSISRLVIPTALETELTRMSKGSDLALFILCMSGLNLTLAKYTGSSDVLIGTSAPKEQGGELIFCRTDCSAEFSVKELINRVKQTVLEAFNCADYSFSEFFAKLQQKSGISTGELCQIAFSYENLQFPPSNTQEFPLALILARTDNQLLLTAEYAANTYSAQTINDFLQNFSNILENIVSKPDAVISEMEILSPTDLEKLLKAGTHGATYPAKLTIQHLFEAQAAKTPDRFALEYSGHGLTYKELNHRVNQVAYRLRELGVVRETIVGLLVERSLEMVIGILGILKSGGAYLPIDPAIPAERIKYILDDSGAGVLLTCGSPGENLNFTGQTLDLTTLRETSVENPDIINQPEDLMYIIYTSGSTGKPKGVMVENRNVLRLMLNDKFQFDFNENDVWTMFHSYCFDFSVWEMYGALLYGGKLVIVPKSTAQNPAEYLEFLRTMKVTVLNQTPTAFYNLSDEELKTPAASLQIRYVIFGGEALKPMMLHKWHQRYPKTRLVNMYGITETTVHVTFKEITATEIASNQSNIGRPIPTLNVYIMDKHLKLLPPGVAGEICVGGDGVARGYLHRPELTAEKFVTNPYRQAERLYRSGDLGRLLPNAELEYLGRADRQVKIRGFRIELGEIESRLLSYPAVKDAIIVARGSENETYLTAYLVAAEEIATGELRDYLGAKLPDYMIPAHFIKIPRMPLTVNGKVDLKALPTPGGRAVLSSEYQAPTNDIEAQLVHIWSKVLEVEEIGINDNFYELGGHSLKATQLISAIYRELERQIPLKEFFRRPTVKTLAAYISSTGESSYPEIKPVVESEYYPVSRGQSRLLIVSELAGQGVSYNMPGMLVITGEIDVEKLTRAFQALIARHESLRTSFAQIAGESVQKIHQTVDFRISYQEAKEEELAKISREFVKPFDLCQAPLLRVGLVKFSGQHLLMFDLHHIIADGVTLDLLVEEFIQLYAGVELPPLKLQYKDYAVWQNTLLQSGMLKDQEEYWLGKLAGLIPTRLPGKKGLSTVQQGAGQVEITFDAGLTAKIEEYCQKQQITKFIFLLAVFKTILSKETRQNDLAVGIPIAGRNVPGVEKLIGLFLNMLVIRSEIDKAMSFTHYVETLKTVVTEAQENQDYPYDELYSRLKENGLQADELFTIEFNYLPVKANENLYLANHPVRPYKNPLLEAKYDLTLYIQEFTQTITMNLVYKPWLFEAYLMERLLHDLQSVSATVLADENLLISQIKLTEAGGEEEAELEYDFDNEEFMV